MVDLNRIASIFEKNNNEEQLSNKNKEMLDKLITDLKKEGVTVTPSVIKEIALQRFLECYSTSDVISTLEYFEVKA